MCRWAGRYWGENGWFRIKMHHNNLGIEQDCDWGVPLPDGSKPADAIDHKENDAAAVVGYVVDSLAMDRKEERFMDAQTELLSIE